jgi:biotin operon repressor/anti-sigma regulatory factor (Ser/Thr protein kinase)
MSTREKILKIIREQGPLSGADIARDLGISRQAVHKHLRTLRCKGSVVKEGAKKGAEFRIGEGEPHIIEKRKKYELDGLGEDSVYEEFSFFLNFESVLSVQADAILHYAFCEMLNNAIEHSKSKYCEVNFKIEPFKVAFTVRDYGIGIFRSIQDKYGLSSEADALRELLKGKTTTMPARHTGEGVFFTSKAGDKVAFRSDRMRLIFHNKKDDVFVERKRNLEGTEVYFEIARYSRRELSEIFNEYAPEEYDFSFEKTRIRVKLYKGKYMSRSEARRLLSRLDDFSVVILDFQDVERIGQGFADEIFRVFASSYPEITIKTENVAPEIEAMIKHVKVDK